MEITKELVDKIDAILARGLSKGVGARDGQMCIEAAICCALDLPHDDDPGCVAAAVRTFKIRLNDATWSSPDARAKGLRDLGIAQLGSLGIVSDVDFAVAIAAKTNEVLIPEMRTIVAKSATEHAADAAEYAEHAADAAEYAEYAAEYAEYAAEYAAKHAADATEHAADAAEYAAEYAKCDPDYFLKLSASLALEVLRDLKSPGCEWVNAPGKAGEYRGKRKKEK